MAKKILLIDTSKCTACRGCQVACKQWNCNEAETTKFVGTYQNPPDLTFKTFNLIRFNEFVKPDGEMMWLFTKDQCRHCDEPGCIEGCPHSEVDNSNGPLYKDPKTGAIVFDNTKCGDCNRECFDGCPFEIPRFDGNKKQIWKCHMCSNRLAVGEEPACVKTCNTGAASFGDADKMVAKAKARLAELKKTYPNANIYPGFDYGVVWILLEKSSKHQLRGDAGPLRRPIKVAGLGPIAAAGALGAAMVKFRERGSKED